MFDRLSIMDVWSWGARQGPVFWSDQFDTVFTTMLHRLSSHSSLSLVLTSLYHQHQFPTSILKPTTDAPHLAFSLPHSHARTTLGISPPVATACCHLGSAVLPARTNVLLGHRGEHNRFNVSPILYACRIGQGSVFWFFGLTNRFDTVFTTLLTDAPPLAFSLPHSHSRTTLGISPLVATPCCHPSRTVLPARTNVLLVH
ncbi:hypothetical protein PIB30_063786, partial [Stylosanthes scabra]|nr:hypothetical protein [Stylosanthes scabra]